MNKSYRQNVESKTLDLKEYMLCDSMNIKFKIKQNQSLVGEVRVMVYLWWSSWFGHTLREISGTFFLDLHCGFRNVFSLWKFINLYPCDLCTFLYVAIVRENVYFNKKQEKEIQSQTSMTPPTKYPTSLKYPHMLVHTRIVIAVSHNLKL